MLVPWFNPSSLSNLESRIGSVALVAAAVVMLSEISARRQVS